MSGASLRARLAAVGIEEIERYDLDPAWRWSHDEALQDLQLHAPTDLRLAADVIEWGDELSQAIEEYFAPNPVPEHFRGVMHDYAQSRDALEQTP